MDDKPNGEVVLQVVLHLTAKFQPLTPGGVRENSSKSTVTYEKN